LVEDFRKLDRNIQEHATSGKVETHDTVCRQVSNRVNHLKEFASRFDVVVFVGGQQSSNAQVLFNVCKEHNSRSFFISKPEEIDMKWFSGAKKVGVCGATSTPPWLMNEVAEKIRLI